MLEPAARSVKNRFYMSAFADFESTSVYYNKSENFRSINKKQIAVYYTCTSSSFVKRKYTAKQIIVKIVVTDANTAATP